MNWRTPTGSAPLWTVSLDSNLGEYLGRWHQASVVPKVACSTKRVALKVVSREIDGDGGALDKSGGPRPVPLAFRPCRSIPILTSTLEGGFDPL
jgi:hypothetical protein